MSSALTSNMGASAMRNAMRTYFNSVGVDIQVTKRTYDSSGAATTNSTLIVKNSYEIKVDRMVSTPTTTAISITGSTSSATVVL
jgi:hypothetical protein